MDAQLLRNLGSIAGIGGIAFGALFLLFRQVLDRTLFSGLTHDQSFRIIVALMIFTFGIAAVGVLTWLISNTVPKGKYVPERSLYVLAGLLVLVLGSATYMVATVPPSPPPPVKQSFMVCLGWSANNRPECATAFRRHQECEIKNNWGEEQWKKVGEEACGKGKPYTTRRAASASGGPCGMTIDFLECA